MTTCKSNKKSNYIIVIMIELVIILILLSLLKSDNSKVLSYSSDPELLNEISLDSMSHELNTTEGDEDLDYNYIINPELLSRYDFLGIGITTYGDKVNEYVKSLGYTSQELYIIDIDDESSYISAEIRIGDLDDTFVVTYDNLLNEFSFQN